MGLEQYERPGIERVSRGEVWGGVAEVWREDERLPKGQENGHLSQM